MRCSAVSVAWVFRTVGRVQPVRVVVRRVGFAECVAVAACLAGAMARL
ncbi:hypothetical protein [Buttiauxella sp. 3AFRM03]|nr:hypothetical protein [Buttiauxella sp. 3AFRM03]